MPLLASLVVAVEVAPWRAAGFTVEGGACQVGSVALRFEPTEGRTGITSWALRGLPGGGTPSAIDGLATAVEYGTTPPRPAPCHPNGVVAIDHLVLTSPDLERSVAVLGEHGFEPRRTREVSGNLRQVFFRMGEVILELVGSPRPNRSAGAARFFGLAFTATDLDRTAAFLDGLVGQPKEAVQPGRRIATVRAEAGLGTAVAIMSA